MRFLLIYLIIINLITAILFIYDKIAAQKEWTRIPEYLLHFLELSGGVFAVIPLMYIIRHKNLKFKYYVVTYLILLLWIVGVLMLKFELYRLANL
ncbi:putative membrane protein [uncultured Paludibacter sp.]|nr:putative membrane protein [uncultured Paludibacter sp.]